MPKSKDLTNDPFLGTIGKFFGETVSDPISPRTTFCGDGLEGLRELDPDQARYWFKQRSAPSTLQVPPKHGETPSGQSIVDSNSSVQEDPVSPLSSASCNTESASVAVGRFNLLDGKTLRNAGLLVQRIRMKRQSVGGNVVADLMRSFLHCHLPQENISALREVLESHKEAGSPVTAFVETHGITALALCEHAPEHELVYSMSAVPGAAERLSCLAYESGFGEALRNCWEDLKVLRNGLEALSERKQVLTSFFHLALKVGNQLNEGGGGPIAARGFKLASLVHISHLRSSLKPHLTLLHFILALMSPQEVEFLHKGQGELHAARDRKSSGVFERCRELLRGHLNVAKQYCLVAPKTRPKLEPELVEMDASSEGVAVEEEIDPDDRFEGHMSHFVQRTRQQARLVLQAWRDVFEMYWELGIYFEDLAGVYPPPAREIEGTEDIFLVFHRLGEAIARAEHDIKKFHIREEIERARRGESLVEAPPQTPAAASKIEEKERPKMNPEVLLMTPPGTPTSAANNRKVSKVASPCRASRGRAVDLVPEFLPAAIDRLRRTSARITKDPEVQSDVSDWSPSPDRRRRKSSVRFAAEVRKRSSDAFSTSSSESSSKRRAAVDAATDRLRRTSARLRASCEGDSQRPSDVSSWSPSPRRRRLNGQLPQDDEESDSDAPEMTPAKSSPGSSGRDETPQKASARKRKDWENHPCEQQ